MHDNENGDARLHNRQMMRYIVSYILGALHPGVYLCRRR